MVQDIEKSDWKAYPEKSGDGAREYTDREKWVVTSLEKSHHHGCQQTGWVSQE